MTHLRHGHHADRLHRNVAHQIWRWLVLPRINRSRSYRDDLAMLPVQRIICPSRALQPCPNGESPWPVSADQRFKPYELFGRTVNLPEAVSALKGDPASVPDTLTASRAR